MKHWSLETSHFLELLMFTLNTYTGHLVCPKKTTSKENEKSALMCIPERKKDQIVLEYSINTTRKVASTLAGHTDSSKRII